MNQDTLTPCRCWSCRKVLGETDGAVLWLNERASIKRPQTIWCTCGGATFWRPGKRAECAQAPHTETLALA